MAQATYKQMLLRKSHHKKHVHSITKNRPLVNHQKPFDAAPILIILRGMRTRFLLLPFLVLLLLPAACSVLEEAGLLETAVPATPPTATIAATPAFSTTPDFTFPAAQEMRPATRVVETLIVWMPPEIAARTADGAAILTDQLQEFNSAYPDLTLVVEQKPIDGPGGVLSYLRTGREIAPSILPDLIALPADQLTSVTTEGLIYPLDDRLAPDTLDALFPAAAAMARVDERLMGYPFALTHLMHFAYSSSQITQTLPLTWGRLITGTQNSLVFPADGRLGALLALSFYLDAGGGLTNEAGQPALQLEPLTLALEQLRQARDNGFISPQSVNLATSADAWQAFAAGAAPILLTTPEQVLSQRGGAPALGYTVVAGLNRPLTPRVSGWVWAVSTPDPARRALAAELIGALTAPGTLGAWSRQSNMLPARRDALDAWPQEDAYLNFVRQELERAEVNGLGASGSVMTALGNAVFEVLSAATTPRVAAEEAIAALTR
jgi:ABC-type glycerol-3-phosphate transport system substrate-binding protein